jgi:hypothetical protein
MHQRILSRYEGTMLTHFDGKTVIPLDAESANYREWLVTCGNERYCIVDECGTWTLMHWREDRRQAWADCLQTVESFLQQHALILAQ